MEKFFCLIVNTIILTHLKGRLRILEERMDQNGYVYDGFHQNARCIGRCVTPDQVNREGRTQVGIRDTISDLSAEGQLRDEKRFSEKAK